MSSNASAPPKPPARRRFALRFSLRAFLGAVTILCVLLAWQLHKAKQQNHAVKAIRDAGGWAHYDYQYPDAETFEFDAAAQPWEPQWLIKLVGVDFFHNVVEVNMVYHNDGSRRFDNRRGPINIAPHLVHFPRLRRLLIRGDFIDDAGMKEVGRLKQLKQLSVWDAENVTDAGVIHLKDMPRLTFIHLEHSQVGEAGLAELAKLPNLEGLSMQKNRFTDAGLAHLAGHSKLKILWIGNPGGNEGLSPISDASVVHLATIPNLEELDLQYTRVTPRGLAPLSKLRHLNLLILNGSTADDLPAVKPLFADGVSIHAKNPPQPVANAPANP